MEKKENRPKLSQICSYGIFSKGLKNKFETAVVNKPSVFKPLEIYRIWDLSRALVVQWVMRWRANLAIPVSVPDRDGYTFNSKRRSIAHTHTTFPFHPPMVLISFWPGLGLPNQRPMLSYQKINPCQNLLRKKQVKVRSTPATTLPVKIMYLGLDIIIKLKFITIFDTCAILQILNYLTKNFESWGA